MHLLYRGIVGVFMGDEISGLNVASIGILALSIENILVQLDVVVVDRIIEGDGDHLRHVFGGQVSRDGGTVF